MSDELKSRLQALVSDQPEPSGRPSDAVLARIRTIRRRRAVGAVTLATAAVAAVAVATGNLTGYDTAPPITKSPGRPETIVTGPPTASPTVVPTRSASPKAGSSVRTPPPVDPPSSTTFTTPPTQRSSPTGTPPAVRTSLGFTFHPAIDGLTVTMSVGASGTVLAPTFEEGGEMDSPRIHDNLIREEYWWGDGTYVATDNDAGVGCWDAKTPVTGQDRKQVAPPHTYARPGEYTFTYRVTYCTPTGEQRFTRSTQLTVQTPTSPSP